MKRVIKAGTTLKEANIKSSRELDPLNVALLDALEAKGVKGRITYSGRSSRGFNVSEGEPNLMIYCPEDLYSKEFKEELEDILRKHRWFPVLERRGRAANGDIKLRVW